MAGEFWLPDRQWAAMLAALIEATPGGLQLIDSTTAEAYRSAAHPDPMRQACQHLRLGRRHRRHLARMDLIEAGA